MAYGDEQEQDFGQSVDTGGGFDPSAGVAGGPEAQPMDSATAISGMADILEQGANDIQAAINTGFDPSASVVGGPESQPEGAGMNTGFDPSASVAGGPESQPSVSLDSLGSQPSLEELSAAIGIDPASLGPGGGAAMCGGPQDVIESQVAGEEVAEEEVAPGQEVATFLSDFNRGMSAQSPEQGLVAKIDALQDQAAQLQAQAGGFDPSAAVPGGAPAQAIDPLAAAVNTVEAEGAAGGWGGSWNDPNTVQGQLAILSGKMDRLENLSMGLQSVQKGYPQPNMSVADYDAYSRSPAAWQNPNTAYTPLESPNYPAWQNPNTVRPPLESPNYPAWQNPNTVRPPLEGANFPPDWYNVNEQRAYPTAMGGNLPISAEQAAATATGGGQGWVDPNAPFDPSAPVVGGAPAQDTTLAPQYSEESPGYQTHNQMYPGHRNAAAMAGVASIRAQFDGTHKAWIEGINNDMKARGIELTHEINGVKTNKHSSADWKEYNDLFTVGEDGVPRDSNGVAMFGTDKQAQAGLGGVLQGLWGGILSGAEKIFQPSTSSGVEDPYSNLGYPDYASGNIPANIRQPATVGDDTRGDNPIDTMRSIYPWARSLPNDILFNAARYPDYLRLLIEADKTGKELPLVVPEWILEGGKNPNTNGNGDEEEETNPFASHPAMQTQQAPAGWGSAPWLT